MNLDPAVAPAHETYRLMINLITPRPIAWVSTLSPRGIANLAPFSFFNGVAANPPTLVFSVVNNRDGSKKDTVRNIEAGSDFVVNVVSHSEHAAMNATSAELPYEVSEFESCGVTPAPAERVAAPRVKEAKACFECALHQVVPVGQGPLAANLIIGRILLVHIDDAALDGQGHVDPDKLDTIGRMGGDGYARTRDRYRLPRPR